MEHTVKINLRGGVVSAGDLYELLVIAEKVGVKEVCFGTRQQLYFTIDEGCTEDLEFSMLAANVPFELNTGRYPNIVSSYVADGLFNTEGWLKEGVYKDIFDLFTYQPALKINLVDVTQTFVPFFTGNLNFISSAINNHWYLYIRFPKSNQVCCCPVLIYSEDVPRVSMLIEALIDANKKKFYNCRQVNEQLFFEMLMPMISSAQPVNTPLVLPDFHLPYYEGFNQQGNKHWLGIYRRNECFSLPFLKEICTLSLQTRIGQLYITPWKSLLIKNILPADRQLWGKLLNKYQMNVRHAANELNWQIEDQCPGALQLKKRLVNEFEEADMRTYRLCFAIKTQPRTGLFGSVVLKKQEKEWEIMYTRDFNPNSKDFITYKKRIPEIDLARHLKELCRIFYTFYSDNEPAENHDAKPVEEEKARVTEKVYQCSHCLSLYDQAFGDNLNGILPGTPFESLTDYACPVCDMPKEEFILTDLAR